MRKKEANNSKQINNQTKNALKKKNIYKEQMNNLISQSQQFNDSRYDKKHQQTSRLNKLKQKAAQEERKFKLQNSLLEYNDTQQQEICLMCFQNNFEKGRYILDCQHVFCNQCIKYWQDVSQKCPVCNKKSNSIFSIFDGQSRLKKINFTPYIKNCEKCSKNNHYNLLYFCDQCNQNCIHTYCDPNLRQESKHQKWVCQNCTYSNFYENKQEISESSQNQEDIDLDGFIVPDEIDEFGDDFYMDSQMTNKEKKNEKAKGKQKQLKRAQHKRKR